MKNIIKNRFDNINTVITNNRGEIKINLIKKLKLTTSNTNKNSEALLLSDTGLDSNLNRNSPSWPSNNKEENISDVEDLRNQQPL